MEKAADIDTSFLLMLMEKSEDEHLEFKKATNTFPHNDLARYSVALANEGGGYLVLGVTDRRPRVVCGTRAFTDELEDAKHRVLQRTQIRIEAQELFVVGNRVVVFSIPSRPRGLPLHIDGSYLVRSGEALAGMRPEQLARIMAETKPDFSAEICPEAVIADLDQLAVEDFRNRWVKKTGNAEILSVSTEQMLNDAELRVNGQLTYAALVLFGTRAALGQYLAQSEVIFEYRSNDATGPAQQRVEFREGFFHWYDKLWQLIDLRNTKQHYQDGLFIWDINTFNEMAIREAILNAVSHRDYCSGASIFVRQYPERIEITNPGGPPPGVTLENILWEQSPRNRRLADAFAKAGLVERSGQGMNRIFEVCIRESKGEPDFNHTDADHFWLTLHGVIQQPEFLRVLEKIGQERLRSFTTADFIVIQAVYTNRAVNERYRPAALRLADEGLLEPSPRDKPNPWILSRRLYSAIKQSGVHTRKSGLDRETNKALLLKHINTSRASGARLEEMRQVLPFLDRGSVQVLLREMRADGQVHHHGKTRAGKWFPGAATEGCHHDED